MTVTHNIFKILIIEKIVQVHTPNGMLLPIFHFDYGIEDTLTPYIWPGLWNTGHI